MSGHPPRVRTAYHEAGHAVVADALGYDLGCVSIEADHEAGWLGYAQHGEQYVVREAGEAVWRKRAREFVQLCLGGLAAECILDTPGWVPETAGRDLEEALETMGGLLGRPAQEADLAPDRQVAEALLRERWHAVRVLAEKLLRHGRIFDAHTVIVGALDMGPDVHPDQVLSEADLKWLADQPPTGPRGPHGDPR